MKKKQNQSPFHDTHILCICYQTTHITNILFCNQQLIKIVKLKLALLSISFPFRVSPFLTKPKTKNTFIPLKRKSASEPNLLKIRLKQSVIERKARAGPLAARRIERLLLAHQRRLQKQVALAQASSM